MCKKGFTLIELVITVGIISLLLVLTMAMTVKFPEDYYMEQHGYMIANDIIYAMEYAKTYNVTLGFTIDIANNQYLIKRGNDILVYRELPKDYNIYTGFERNEFYITNLGRVNRFGSITINNEKGKYVKITTTIRTGRVLVEVHE